MDSMDTKDYIETLGRSAAAAAMVMASMPTVRKNSALYELAEQFSAREQMILDANGKDLRTARETDLSAALLDRLAITAKGVAAMAEGVIQVAKLPDPVGEISAMSFRPSGIQVGRMRVPLGVIGIIYESRPNVTADAAALCLKSGNASILRGGSEAFHTNRAIAECISAALHQAGLPQAAVNVLETTDRQAVGALLALDQYVDLIVPRGGKSLIERVTRESSIPVLKHLDGICHVYVDQYADLDMAADIAFNAKTQRYGVCNAMETLLVAEAVASEFLPDIAERYRRHGVELRGCERCRELVVDLIPATEEDWQTEYLAPVLSIRVVADLDAAMAHIARYGSGHTDAIVTRDWQNANRFLREVDSSSVMVNASTRFADGFEYGLGAEIGISTNKLHARGPVGLEGLTTQKFIVFGNGQIRF